MSTMSCIRRKMTADKDRRIYNLGKKRAIRVEQNKPDYRKADKDEKRSRIGAILSRFQFRRKVGG